MKTTWITPVSIVIALGALAFAFSRDCSLRRNTVAPDRLGDVTWLATTLELTPDQTETVRKLHEDYRVRLAQCCSTHCKARVALAQALAAEDQDGADAESVIPRMCSAYEETERTTLAHLRSVRSILTPGQKASFDLWFQTCRCQSCPSQNCATHTPKEKRP